jgi:N-acetyl-gamma-glutamylphosphate reductase
MIVTIFGANGNLSVRITRLLLQKPNVSVRGYARNISKIPEDIRNHQQYKAIQGEVSTVICSFKSL